MIKANELRIGNYYYNQSGHLNQTTTISKYKDLGVNHDLIDPVPLTEEWLFKFGFEREGGKAYWVLPYIKIHSVPTIDGDEILMMPNNRYACQIKHVHQLQNLYFALTNEELKIKDNQQNK